MRSRRSPTEPAGLSRSATFSSWCHAYRNQSESHNPSLTSLDLSALLPIQKSDPKIPGIISTVMLRALLLLCTVIRSLGLIKHGKERLLKDGWKTGYGNLRCGYEEDPSHMYSVRRETCTPPTISYRRIIVLSCQTLECTTG